MRLGSRGEGQRRGGFIGYDVGLNGGGVVGIVCIFFAKVGSSGLGYMVARYCDYARVFNGA